ncbi:MAG TPA: response regulator [Tepidisphaeraceae bacterium]|jgi:FixJ family two-component response regulator|nr:response regulator [Tepidisphaeraceae bacterium]
MSPTAIATKKRASKAVPRLLVVDDESDLVEMLRDVVGKKIDCKILSAGDLDEARRIISKEQVSLLVTDLHLPGGDGMSLLPELYERIPTANAIVITGKPTVNGAINAMRAGAADYLPKPFSAEQIVDRISKALQRQAAAAKTEKRLDRLRDAVRRLNISRRMVTKKVDLLCNDLVAAYGELSRQFDDVRNQESFRKLLGEANDLEQLLCHAMDWLLRKTGYCNVAVWLASEEEGYQLGAYMKYTVPGEDSLTNAMRSGIVPMAVKDNLVHFSAEQAEQNLTPAELQHMKDQTVMAVNCTYLGESLAVLVLFRDDRSPFTEEDSTMLKAISSIFATSLAGMVRREDDGSDDDETGGLLEDESSDGEKPKRREKNNDADWWKRGESPPF